MSEEGSGPPSPETAQVPDWGDEEDEEDEEMDERAAAVASRIASFVAARRDADSAMAAEELVRLAVMFEKEESDFRHSQSDLFSRERESHGMWSMLAVAGDHATFLQETFALLTDRADAVVQAAAARALSAAAPGLACYPTLQQSMFMEMLTADAMEDALFGWVESAALPMCTYASRLLAFALLDDRCADEAVRKGLVPKLLRRLRGIVFEDSSVVGAPGAKGGADGEQELSGQELLKREKGYIVQCCCVLMSYKETLACALQEGALDVILAINRVLTVLIAPNSSGPTGCHDALRMLGALLSHRKFCLVFLDAGGLAKLLPVQQTEYCASSIALCLLSMACFRGVVDKVCRLTDPNPQDLTAFALRLLELEDDTASCNILQFLAKVLSYQVFLTAFDGLKGALVLNRSARRMLDSAVEGRSLAKNVVKYNSCALRNYLRAHLLFAHQHIVNASAPDHASAGTSASKPGPKLINKSVDCEADDQVAEACMSIERLGRFHELATWMEALQQVVSHGGMRSLTELLTLSSNLRMPEMAVFSLNALQVICLLPVVRVEFAEQLLEDETSHRTGMRVLVDAAGGSVFPDGHVICAALHVLCTCIGCSAPPMTLRAVQRGGGARDVHGGTPGRGHHHQEEKAVWGSLVWESAPPSAACRRIWALLQECDGIKVLSSLTKKSEHSCADAIRALACRSLLGLSHDGRILQILQETQLALALTELVKKEQRVRTTVRDVQAAAFRLVAMRLISRVTGRAQHTVLGVAGDSAVRMMEKAATVEQAAITYDRKELLRLVHSHLVSLGMDKSASTLQLEADLEDPTSSLHHTQTPHTPHLPHTPSRQTPARPIFQTASPHRASASRTPQGGGGGSAFKAMNEASSSSSKAAVHGTYHQNNSNNHPPLHVRMDAIQGSASKEAVAASREGLATKEGASVGSVGREGGGMAEGTPGGTAGLHHGLRIAEKASNSLDNIVKTYLRKLHSECRNPIRVLPPLSLANAHKGPWYQGPGIGAPMHSTDASTNVTCRVLGRECGWGGFNESRHGGRGGGGLMRQFVYSRFKPYPWRFTDSPDASTSNAGLSTGAFLRTHEGRNACLLGGTKKGTLCRFNFDMPTPVWEVQVHDEAVTRVQVGGSAVTAGMRVLSSSEKEARVWEVDEQEGSIGEAPMLSVPECANASFNNGCDRIVGIGTRGSTLVVDAETGATICTLQEPGHSGAGAGAASMRAMRHRRACFSPDDQMILSDGVLWDPRVTSSYVHKFDRFASYGGGSFHPNRPEVIISAAVWDIRTNFKLLRWCPPLDQMHTVFSPSGHVMYGFLKYFEEEAGAGASHRMHVRKYKHMFRTVDAVTYTDIATVELKDNVADLIVDTRDDVIALMESAKDSFAGYSGTTCRLYEVGRQKASRSDDEDEEEDEEANEGSEDEDMDDGGSDALGGLFNGGGGQAALLGELLGSDMSGLDDDEDDDDDGEDEDDGIDDMDEDEFEEMLNGVDGDDGE